MPPTASLLPVPAALSWTDGRLPVGPGFRVAITSFSDARLRGGVERALARLGRRLEVPLAPATSDPTGAALVIAVAAAGPALPRLGDDESYNLEISPARATLRAPNVVGALRGLETLLQLVQTAPAGAFLPAVKIDDAPRFPWRGLMLDVARHWQPLDVIKRNLDGMALVKLNVLHLHLTEDQGFRIESLTHPELHEQGSDGQFFTQAQIREIIAYAAARGIRVVPEFDIPGHATSWLVSHPELGSAPGPYSIERRWGIFDPVLDPTNEQVYSLLEDFLGEMAALFPDEYLHIGGDENNGVHWNANARIQAFIRERGLKDNEGLHAHFNRRVGDILRRHGKRLVGWDEILHPDLPQDSVIHSWRGTEALAAAAVRGYSGILSNGYYIDLNYPASDHYLNDPLPADTALTAEQQRRILGGEATMWAEWVTPAHIDTRIWPRTAAIAERLWSPREVRDVDDMYRRLAVTDLRLQEVGTLQGQWPRLDRFAPPIAAALHTLAAVIEPVKQYRRGGLQPDHNQLTPLDELADWSRPDARPVREFAGALDCWLAAGGRDAAAAEPLLATLAAWRAAGEVAATAPADTSAVQQGRVQTAKALVELCRLGTEALVARLQSRPATAAQRAAAQAALAAAATPNAAAVEFPLVPALERLLAAP